MGSSWYQVIVSGMACPPLRASRVAQCPSLVGWLFVVNARPVSLGRSGSQTTALAAETVIALTPLFAQLGVSYADWDRPQGARSKLMLHRLWYVPITDVQQLWPLPRR